MVRLGSGRREEGLYRIQGLAVQTVLARTTNSQGEKRKCTFGSISGRSCRIEPSAWSKVTLNQQGFLYAGKYVGLTRNRINILHGYIVIGNQVIYDKFLICSRKRSLLLAINGWSIPLFRRAEKGCLRSLPSSTMTSSSFRNGIAAMNTTTTASASLCSVV